MERCTNLIVPRVNQVMTFKEAKPKFYPSYF